MIGVPAGPTLFALAAILLPLRFARAIRRAFRHPEFGSVLFLVVVTLATVGYGDLVPTTPASRSPCSTSSPGLA